MNNPAFIPGVINVSFFTPGVMNDPFFTPPIKSETCQVVDAEQCNLEVSFTCYSATM